MIPTVSGSRRLGLACGVAVVASAVAGCAGPATPPTAADCSSQVRLEGRVYTSHGFTDRDGTRVEDTRWHVQALAGLTLPFGGAGVFSVGLGPRFRLGEVSVEEARVDTDVLVRFALQASVGWAF